MGATYWWLGFLTSVLSIVFLLKQGFDLGFVAPLQRVLDFYDWTTRLALGWAEPWIQEQLKPVSRWLGLELKLSASWRHVFVLMELYFGAHARANWNQGRPRFGLFTAVWGLIVALIASTMAGAIALRDPNANLLFAGFPIFGLV